MPVSSGAHEEVITARCNRCVRGRKAQPQNDGVVSVLADSREGRRMSKKRCWEGSKAGTAPGNAHSPSHSAGWTTVPPKGTHTAYTPCVTVQQSSQGHITRMRSTVLTAQSVSFGRKDLGLLKGLHLDGGGGCFSKLYLPNMLAHEYP